MSTHPRFAAHLRKMLGRLQAPAPKSVLTGAPAAAPEQIDRERVHLLFAYPVFPASLSIFVGAWYAWFYRHQVAPWPLLLWLVCLSGLVGARILLVRSARTRPNSTRALRRERDLLALLAASGLAWGLGTALFVPPHSASHQLVASFVLAGLTASNASTYGASALAFPAFALPALAPFAVRLLSFGTQEGFMMGSLVLLYGVALSMVARRTHRSMSEALYLRLENRELIDTLMETSQELETKASTQEAMLLTLEQRDEILKAISVASERWLHERSWQNNPVKILQTLATAARATAVWLDQVEACDETQLKPGLRVTWPDSVTAFGPSTAPLPFWAGYSPWAELLFSRQPIVRSYQDLGAEERHYAGGRRFGTIAVLPVFLADDWWGTLSFEAPGKEVHWSESELDALITAANIVGATLASQEAQEALRMSDARFQLMAENTSDLFCLHHPDGRFLYLSPSCRRLLGFDPRDLVNTDPAELVVEADRERLRRDLRGVFLKREETTTAYRVQAAGGEIAWFETHTRPVYDERGKITRLVSSSRDISHRKEVEEALFREKELAQITLHSIGDGVLTTDDNGQLLSVNPAAQQLLGCDSSVVGKPLYDLFGGSSRGRQHPIARLIRRALHSQQLASSPEPIPLDLEEHEERAVEVSVSPIRNRGGRAVGAVAIMHDVTSTRLLAQQLSYQASHDALTGLMNRREFERQLATLIERAHLLGPRGVLCYVDLDQFKIVNDTSGHVAGDELLRQVSTLLRSQVRQTDVVARLGGDEFGILLSDCTLDKAIDIANGICESLQDFRFSWEERVFRIGASIGLVGVDPRIGRVNELMTAADNACYCAKEQGRNRVYAHRIDDQTLERRKGQMHWVSQLHRALDQDRFELFYQPIVEPTTSVIDTSRIEILVSLVDQNGERVSPGSFIPAAERFNAMPGIDRWVIENTLGAFSAHWRQSTEPLVRECFINLSGTSVVDRSFLPFVREQIDQHQIPRDVLCFEITETAAIANLTDAVRFMEELKELGCRFALDDFGSGLSSFAYLRTLPIDVLKIDGMFVRDIATDSVDFAIVEAIHRVAQLLGLRTIAEFVETEDVLAKLMFLGIDLVQGYGLARPAPLRELLRKIEAPILTLQS